MAAIIFINRNIFISRRTDVAKGIDCLVVEVVAAGIEEVVEVDTLVVAEEDMVAASSYSYYSSYYSSSYLTSSLVVAAVVVVADVVEVVAGNCRRYLMLKVEEEPVVHNCRR